MDVLISHLSFLLRNPFRYSLALIKMIMPFHHSWKDRYRSFLHFLEGAVFARQMQKDGVGHLHAHWASHTGSVARAVHLLSGIPYSISAHAIDIWHDKLLMKQKLKEARFFACCSRYGKSEVLKQGAPEDSDKVHLVYHGIDIRRFVLPPEGVRSNNLILSVGRLDPAKGFYDLITACKFLAERKLDFVCEIYGKGPDYGRLRNHIEELGLSLFVHLKGSIPQEQLLAQYHRAAIFALPCVKIENTLFDGLPNVLVEAMATGLPVITTNISAIPELMEDGKNGYMVSSGDPKSIAQHLMLLLRDHDLRLRMGHSAREKVVREFDNTKCIDQLIGLIERETGTSPQCISEFSSALTPALN